MKLAKTFKAFLIAAIIAVFLAVEPASAARVIVYPRAVVIPRGHVHTARCGHYYYRHHWYFVPSHVHGRHCGHVFVHGVWVVR